jgi:hypothetical protein
MTVRLLLMPWILINGIILFECPVSLVCTVQVPVDFNIHTPNFIEEVEN